MLVLSRKVGERVLIGDNIVLTIVRVTPGNVRIGIEAPEDTPIIREELAGTEPPVRGQRLVGQGSSERWAYK